jgi:hypothetical protein
VNDAGQRSNAEKSNGFSTRGTTVEKLCGCLQKLLMVGNCDLQAQNFC